MIFNKLFEHLDDLKDTLTTPAAFEKYAFIGVVATAVVTAIATKKAIDILNEAKEEPEVYEEIREGEVFEVHEEKKPKPIVYLKIAGCFVPVTCVALLTMLMMHKTVISAFDTIDDLSVALNASLERTEKYKSLAAGAVAADVSAKMAQRDSDDDTRGEFDENGERYYWFYLEGFDETSDRYFKATLSEVKAAFYELNRHMVGTLRATVDDFCKIMRIESCKEFALWGWSYDLGSDNGYEWIDYYLEELTYDDESIGYEIHFPFDPMFAPEFDDEYYELIGDYHEHH